MTAGAATILCPEAPGDARAVDAVVTSAFGNDAEARLVRRLRGQEGVFSLVARSGSELVGHILFSPIEGREPDRGFRGVGLAPMAVVPGRQKQGIGSALVRDGLEECRKRKLGLVVVLGHIEYYPRFGFVPASRLGLSCQWPEAGDHFMALELIPGHAAGSR